MDNYDNENFSNDDTLKKFNEGEINSVDFSKNKNYLLSSGKDDLISVLDIETESYIQKIQNNVDGCDNTLFINEGKLILSSSMRDYRIILWSIETNEKLFSFLGHSNKVTDITIHPFNNKQFLSSSLDKTSRLWDLTKRKCLFVFQDSNCAVFNSSGKLIASVTSEYLKKSDEYINYVNIYYIEDIQNGPFKVFIIYEMNSIHQIKFSSDDLLLFLKDVNNKCKSYNIFDNSLTHTITPGDDNNYLNETYNNGKIRSKFDLFDLNDTHDYFAIGSKEGKVYLWNTSTNYDKAFIVNILKHHKENSNCVKFWPKNNIIITGGHNIVLWKENNI